MSPNSLLLPVLVANVAVFAYLNADRVKTFIAGVRGQRQIKAFRYAGLLVLVLAASFTHAKECTIKEQQHVNCTPKCGFNKACVKRELASYDTEIVAGVIRDQDYESALAIAKANGIDTRTWEWNSQMGYSKGSDKLLETRRYESSLTGIAWLDNALRYTWAHAGALTILSILIFLVLHFGGGSESNETNINDHFDPEYRTGFDRDYHGDDAFEVPDGMHSGHEPVPVRARSASASR